MALSLSEDCLLKLREYVASLGGTLEGEWRCRAQMRETGSRSGSVDMWFRAPGGEVYRSKVAVARGLGLLEPAEPPAPRPPKPPGTGHNTRKPRHMPLGGPPPARGGHHRPSPPWNGELTVPDLAELLMSMPDGDLDGRYQGRLTWKGRTNIRNPAIAVALELLLESRGMARDSPMVLAPAPAVPLALPIRLSPVVPPAGSGGPRILMSFELPPGSIPADPPVTAHQSGHSSGSACDDTQHVSVELEVQQDDESRPVRLTLRAATLAVEYGKQQQGEEPAQPQQLEVQHPPPVALVTIPVVKAEQAPSCPPLALLSSLRPGMALPVPSHGMAAHLPYQQQQLAAAGSMPLGAAPDGAPPQQPQPEAAALAAAAGPCSEQRAAWGSSHVAAGAALATATPQHGAEGLGARAPVAASELGRDAAVATAVAAAGRDIPAPAEFMEAGGEAEAMEVDGVRGCGSIRAESPASWISGLDESVADALLGLPHAAPPPAEPAYDYHHQQHYQQQQQQDHQQWGGSSGIGSPSLRPPRPSSESLRGKSPEEVEAALMDRLRRYVNELGHELPSGWTVKASVRKTGVSAGGIDAYYYAPGGKRCKSMVKVAEALGLGALVPPSPTQHKGALAMTQASLPASPSVLPKAAPIAAVVGGGGSALLVGAGRPPPRRQASPVAFGALGAIGYNAAPQFPPSPQPSSKSAAFLSPEIDQSLAEFSFPPPLVPLAQLAMQHAQHAVIHQPVQQHAALAELMQRPSMPPSVLPRLVGATLGQVQQAPVARQQQPPQQQNAPAPASGVGALQAVGQPAQQPVDARPSAGTGHQAIPDLPPLQPHDVQLALAAAQAGLQPLRIPGQSPTSVGRLGRRGQLLAGKKRRRSLPEPSSPGGDSSGSGSEDESDEDEGEESDGDSDSGSQEPDSGSGSQEPGSASDSRSERESGGASGSQEPDSGSGSEEAAASSPRDSLPGAPPLGGAAVPLPGGVSMASREGTGSEGGGSKKGGGKQTGEQRNGAGRSGGGAGQQPGGKQSGGGAGGGGGGKRPGGGAGGDKGGPGKGGGKGGSGEAGEEKGRHKRKRAKKSPFSPSAAAAATAAAAAAKENNGKAQGAATAVGAAVGKKKRTRQKKKPGESEKLVNNYDRMLNRLRSQLSRLRQEQMLVEAYAADGWRGASREKVKPVAEIKRAKEQIARCKEAIRECVRYCDEAEGDRPIPAELFDETGELDCDHMFCSKCKLNHASDDNDIILCDGPCNRAYHVQCLVPPVDPEALPEEEGWLCPACDRKCDMIDLINDEFGTEYEIETEWDQILAPGTLPKSPNAVPGSPRAAVDLDRLEGLLEGADLPSEDEEDEDYVESASDDEEGSRRRGGSGSSGGRGSPSAPSNDDSSDGGSDEEGEGGSSAGRRRPGRGDSDNSSDAGSLASEEGLLGEIEELEVEDAAGPGASRRRKGAEGEGGEENGGEEDEGSARAGGSTGEADAALILNTKRRRVAVDYLALNAEMFGDVEAHEGEFEEEEEEDEVWSPRARKRPAQKQQGPQEKEKGSE